MFTAESIDSARVSSSEEFGARSIFAALLMSIKATVHFYLIKMQVDRQEKVTLLP